MIPIWNLDLGHIIGNPMYFIVSTSKMYGLLTHLVIILAGCVGGLHNKTIFLLAPSTKAFLHCWGVVVIIVTSLSLKMDFFLILWIMDLDWNFDWACQF